MWFRSQFQRWLIVTTSNGMKNCFGSILHRYFLIGTHGTPNIKMQNHLLFIRILKTVDKEFRYVLPSFSNRNFKDMTYTGYLIANQAKWFCSGEGIDYDFCRYCGSYMFMRKAILCQIYPFLFFWCFSASRGWWYVKTEKKFLRKTVWL